MASEHALRRSRHRRARHLAHSLGLCALIAAAAAAAPTAVHAAGILVRLPGSERLVSQEEVKGAVDRAAGTYLLRARGTSAEQIAHPPALSLRKLVTLAGGSPDTVSFLSITRPNGSLAILRRGDLAEASPFADGPPIVWTDAGGVRYLRPLRGPGDANAADNIGITEGNLIVRVHQGPLLEVRADASRRTVPAGEPVHLEAEVRGGAMPGVALTFSWSFGDGTRRRGPALRHAFARPGVYETIVTVSGSDDSGGASDPLRISVGDPPKGKPDGGGGREDPRRAPAQGPVAGPPDGGGGTASAPGASGTAAVPPSPGAPATGPSSPPPSRGSESRTRRPVRSREDASSGQLVRGTLVSSRPEAGLPGERPQAIASAGPAAARLGSEPRRESITVAAGILAALAFVGLGIRRERRALHNRPEVPT
jgi:hypothetical protein